MSYHAAALYTVKVHPRRKPDDLQLLGAIGDEDDPARLLWALNGYLPEIRAESEKGDKTLTCTSVEIDEARGEIRALLEVGIKGQRVDIFDEEGQLQFGQLPGHEGKVRSAALLRIPPDGNLGHIAVYVPNRRGAMGLMKRALTSRFSEDFPRHMLKINPAVEGTALRQAVEQDLVAKVALVRYDRNTDTFQGGSSKWVKRGDGAEIALEIRAHKTHLVTGLLKRFLNGEQEVFGEIVEFEGVEFEHAKVQVEQDGKRRTYNIEKPESGHAITSEIDDELEFEDGWATPDTLFGALRRALPTVTPGA